jgi:hypothetical protein
MARRNKKKKLEDELLLDKAEFYEIGNNPLMETIMAVLKDVNINVILE